MFLFSGRAKKKTIIFEKLNKCFKKYGGLL